ncbi:hypothetical protein [Nitrosomonas ureae]|uniref:Uncharacterized protein n=1 Tax=Nitrosomonas ureae TaxID=44577 RepID=A0A1H5W327_9PROT|nr:hypothetical protein [Nitrosomonas ureae]SEF93636.1 hypothetical protein SAMN05216334_11620 [Nitrosomonas ureae]
MKFIWFFLHIVALSTFIEPIQVASSNPPLIEGGIDKSGAVRIAQTGAADLKTVADKSVDHSKSLPAIVPETKPDANEQLTSYYRRPDGYAANPESDPPRYVRRLSDIGISDLTWLNTGLEHRTRY